jgi:hypothetical protein
MRTSLLELFAFLLEVPHEPAVAEVPKDEEEQEPHLDCSIAQVDDSRGTTWTVLADAALSKLLAEVLDEASEARALAKAVTPTTKLLHPR